MIVLRSRGLPGSGRWLTIHTAHTFPVLSSKTQNKEEMRTATARAIGPAPIQFSQLAPTAKTTGALAAGKLNFEYSWELTGVYAKFMGAAAEFMSWLR
jgi:hypothetical protein